MHTKLHNLPVDKIKRDPTQPRQTIDKERIEEIGASMLTEGVINPIEVDEDMVIVTGEMRWRAAKFAGLATIPAKIIKISPQKRFLRQVIENIHHNTMSDWDTAKALEKLRNDLMSNAMEKRHHGGIDDQGIRRLGRLIGKSPRFIIDHLEILGASKKIRTAIKTGKISYTFLRAIRRVPEKFKEPMEKKILQGEFKQRDSAVEVAVALQKNPDKAEKILEVDYKLYKTPADVILKLSQIVPRFSDIIRDSFTPPKELTEIKNSLLNWLEKYPRQILAPAHYDRTTLTFQVMVEAMNHWAVDRKALNDKYRSGS